jgi:hypothetical protein
VRSAEPIGTPKRWVEPTTRRRPFTGRDEQRQCEQVGRDNQMAAACLDRRGERAIVADVTVRAGILQQHAEGIGRRASSAGPHDHVDSKRRRARAHDVDRLGEYVVRDEKSASLLFEPTRRTSVIASLRRSPRQASTRWRSPSRSDRRPSSEN